MNGKERVLNYLQTHKSLTQLEAINMWLDWRISDKIYRLKKDGHNIKSEQMAVKKADGTTGYVARYSLEEMIKENENHIPGY